MAHLSEFTIGLPVYNEARYIEQTLRSIIDTVGESVPVLVSDNHSTDGTREIVEEFIIQNPSVRLVINRDDRVASNFMNCLLHARSEFFCWISGHDLMCGDFWRQAFDMLRSDSDLIWVYGSCGVVDANGDQHVTEVRLDSDVDNSGLSDLEILEKLVKVCSGMFVHGVFRTSAMTNCPLAGGWASDRCIIAYACFRGEVRWLHSRAIVRRIQRSAGGGETEEQRDDRYRKWGFLEYEHSGLDPNRYMRLKLLRIYLGERFGRVGIAEVRKAIKTLFREESWKRDLQVLWQLRKLRPVETFFPSSLRGSKMTIGQIIGRTKPRQSLNGRVRQAARPLWKRVLRRLTRLLRKPAPKRRGKAPTQRHAAPNPRIEAQRRLQQVAAGGGPLRIVVGAAHTLYDGWISTNIDSLNLLDLSDWQTVVGDLKLDRVLAEHVWEHLSPDDGIKALKNVAMHLKSGGRVRIAVPDGHHPDASYIEHVRPGGIGPGADDHKILYTLETLEAAVRKAGLEPEVMEYWDTKGRFHAREWDPVDGQVLRSKEHDPRNADGILHYTSLIVDGVKP